MERCHQGMVQEVGLEPTKPFRAADLQSAAIATMRPLHWNEDFLHQNPLWFMNFRHKQTATISSFCPMDHFPTMIFPLQTLRGEESP